MLRLSKKYGGLQFFAPVTLNITVNGTAYVIFDGGTWEACQPGNSDNFTISGNNVVWNDGTILQYNGADVLPTDTVIDNGAYTTRANVSRLSVDVSTLAGWDALSAGAHDITIVAKASGFKDSAPSAAVSVTKAASTKTLAAGTYKWVTVPIEAETALGNGVETNMNFTSNGTNFTTVKATVIVDTKISKIVYDSTIAYEKEEGGWTNTTYQTITLATDQQVSADFYEWAITGGNLVQETAAGTWLLNTNLGTGVDNYLFYVNITIPNVRGSGVVSFNRISADLASDPGNTIIRGDGFASYYVTESSSGTSWGGNQNDVRFRQNDTVSSLDYGKTSANGIKLRTITIIDGDDIANPDLISWLKQHAVKQS